MGLWRDVIFRPTTCQIVQVFKYCISFPDCFTHARTIDWGMAFVKFHENLLIIDGEINEKHALNIIVSKTVTC